jgi:hypothetical protein
MAGEKTDRPEGAPITVRNINKEEILRRWTSGTKLTRMYTAEKGYAPARRSVVLDNPERIVLAQADGKKGHSEPAEIAFEEGDTVQEMSCPTWDRNAIRITSADGKRDAIYVEGFAA